MKCENCGEPFEPKSKRARFCCKSCRTTFKTKELAKKAYEAKKTLDRTCKRCEKPIPAERRLGAKYCSYECYYSVSGYINRDPLYHVNYHNANKENGRKKAKERRRRLLSTGAGRKKSADSQARYRRLAGTPTAEELKKKRIIEKITSAKNQKPFMIYYAPKSWVTFCESIRNTGAVEYKSKSTWYAAQLAKAEAERYREKYRNNEAFRHSEIMRSGHAKKIRKATTDVTITNDAIEKLLNERATCPYCGGRLVADNRVLDHLDPVALYGETSIANLTVCCKRCNAKKRDKPFDVWLFDVPEKMRNVALRMYKKKRGKHPGNYLLPMFFSNLS
jgi:5-methylcytosine-specific restriction endonuclease McrA